MALIILSMMILMMVSMTSGQGLRYSQQMFDAFDDSAQDSSSDSCVVLSVSIGENGKSGTIKAQLKSEWAPKTVKNFLAYTDKKYYDNTVFHRIIPNFMVQGGGFAEDFYAGNRNQKRGGMAPIQNEAGVHNAIGTLSMARTNDPNSATSQFFINLVENSFLDKSASSAGYAVFGSVVSGMDLVQSMGIVSTGNLNGMQDVPQSPVVLRSVRRVPC